MPPICSIPLSLFFAVCTLPFFVRLTWAHDSAWNGHTDSGSTVPALFTPYYVPPGAKGHDSSSRLIQYKGEWTHSFSNEYVQKTMHSTVDPLAAFWFTFVGTGIEWFGNTDNRHGFARVYIDGSLVKEANNWSNNSKPLQQQRLFWVYDLPFGKHTMKVVNEGRTVMDVDALVVTLGQDPTLLQPNSLVSGNRSRSSQVMLSATQSSSTPHWNLVQKGSTGVNAMQLAVISPTLAIIIDKVEHNPLTISGHPAWATLYNLVTHAVRPLNVLSNSFCAGGSFLSNGTLINVGGNPVVETHTSAADFGDANGMQSIRMIGPCDNDSGEGCVILEDHRIRMASPRWYSTTVRISDGSAMIIGGSKKGGWINNATTNNPTIEYFPSKGIHGSKGLPIYLSFLVETLNANLFPIAFFLPSGQVFIAANQDAILYDWIENKERKLGRIPNGVRVTYPMAGTGLLLPLFHENNYQPEVLLCGGSTIDDRRTSSEISSQEPASTQCARMVLTEEGILSGWQVEHMPEPRTMLDAVLLPTGSVLLVNGAGSGISGYGNVKDRVGESNADKPMFSPVLYDPRAPPGERFSKSGMPTSNIPRMYHSVASLTASGSIMIAGSNPNLDRSEFKYGTEYRVEWLEPSYIFMERPGITECPKIIGYGEHILLKYRSSAQAQGDARVALMDFGFVTHAVHANSRLVYLPVSLQDGNVAFTGPPNGNVYPPGPGFIFLIVNDVPSVGCKVIIGSGQSPAVDEDARNYMLKNTPSQW